MFLVPHHEVFGQKSGKTGLSSRPYKGSIFSLGDVSAHADEHPAVVTKGRVRALGKALSP